MKIQSLLNELKQIESYKRFKHEHPDAFLMAGFFIFVDEENRQQIQLDFFLPSENKIASFEYPFAEFKIHPDEIKNVSELNLELKVDVNNLREEVEKAKEKTRPGMKIDKLIAILKDNKWNITVLSRGLDIIRMNINALTGEIEKNEKANLGDFMRVSKK